MDSLLSPLYAVVSWILVAFHAVLGPVFGQNWGWTLSIVGLVIVIRILLIPLFVKQIKSQRAMQVLAPRMKEIQAKYKDRERQSQELMKLYKETGTNPMSSCLPIVAQSPVFIALYRVLAGIAANPRKGHGAFASNPDLLNSAADARLLGAPISDTLRTATTTHTMVTAIVLIVLMVASQFITQRQLIMKNLPASAQQDNKMLQQQKMMMYVFPLIFAFVGINFPIGILIYWFTSNLWSMGQQFYVIHRMPTPGSKAELALKERQAARGGQAGAAGGQPGGWLRGRLGGLGGRSQQPTTPASPPAAADSAPASGEEGGVRPKRQRQQPVRQPKSKRSSGPPRKG